MTDRSFSARYGPWALVAGASDGVGQAFAESLAGQGVNVVLLARRRGALEQIAGSIQSRFGVKTRVIAMDLAAPGASAQVLAQVSDLEVGFFVYCPGADSNYKPFLASSLGVAESMVQRNCMVPVQLCHGLCGPMVQRGRGAVVILGSGAGLAGATNMAAYSASKAFDMVFAEALWCELKPKGIDVLGLILGETDTPALRKLRFERGLARGPDEPVKRAQTPHDVVNDAMANLAKGPTRFSNKVMRRGLKLVFPFSRNTIVGLMVKAGEKVMGKD